MNGPRFLTTTHYFTNAAPSPPSPQERVLSASCDRILLHNCKAKYTFAAVPVIHGLQCQTAVCGKWPHFEQAGRLQLGGDARVWCLGLVDAVRIMQVVGLGFRDLSATALTRSVRLSLSIEDVNGEAWQLKVPRQ